MALTIACATCRKQLVLPESLLDQMVSCPSCHTAFSVADQSGKLSIRLPGQELLPAVPRPAEEIPTVLPAPGRAPFVPLSTGPRPFVFRVKVTDDPEKLLVGTLQARISNAGLELRDPNDCVYPIPVGSQADYLGGNVLRVSLSGRSITLRITQRACQQSRLAEDIVLFLGQKRTVPRLKDYRPRLAPRLAAWLPLLAAICVLPFGIGGWIGALTWLGLGTVLSFISWLMMRNEARPLPRRFVRLSVAWCVGIVILGPLVPGVLYVRREYFPPPIVWRGYVSSDGLWHARMPGQPTVVKKPLFDNTGKANQPIPARWEVAFVQLPPYRAAFEVWQSDLPVEEFDATTTEAHFDKIRDDFLQAHPLMEKSSDWESP
ncbi:MAG TPA: hypothetical protein VE988_08985, partial [Gemmataceae bacterium]|nr:hypothetical protein [Gemmataceae bacterium]